MENSREKQIEDKEEVIANSATPSCDTCAFYNEDRDNQPCCYCVDHDCWEKGEDDEQR